MSWYTQPENVQLVKNIVTSFKRTTGQELSAWFKTGNISTEMDGIELAKACESAPFALLSHDGTPTGGHDPKFVYANRRGLELFKYPLETMLKTESKYSAEAQNREERQKMLEQTVSKGYFSGYKGVRISMTGKRFRIEDGVIWNVYNGDEIIGQGAAFAHTTPLDN